MKEIAIESTVILRMAEGGSKLSEEDIYGALKGLSVPVCLNDIKSPTKEFIIRVFECFLKCLQISPYDLKTWEANSHIEDPEIYEEAQYQILLAMTMSYIFDNSGLSIMYKDIVEPKPKRTKKILYYVLTFWKFYLQKYSEFCGVEKTFEDEKKKIEDMLHENELLDGKYQDRLNVLKTMPNKDKLEMIIEENTEKLKKLHAQKKKIESDYQDLKTDESNLKQKIGVMDIKIAGAKKKLEDLDQHILSSPDRMTKEIQILKDKIKLKDLKIKEKENELKEADQRLQTQKRSLNDYEKAMAVLNDLKKHSDCLRETVKSVSAMLQKTEEEEEKVRKIELDLKHQEELQLHHDQKAAKDVLNAKKQKETLTELLNMLQKEEIREKKELESIKSAVDKMQLKIDDVSDDILQLQQRYKEVSVEVSKRMSDYTKKMETCGNSFKADCEELERNIKKFQRP